MPDTTGETPYGLEECKMLNEIVLNKLKSFFEKNPVALGQPTLPNEITLIENSLNKALDEDFKQFTSTFGGCAVRDALIYGIHNSEFLGDETIIELNKNMSQYLDDISYHLIIGIDGSGNPIYINDAKAIMLYDHDVNEEVMLSDSFENYLNDLLDR